MALQNNLNIVTIQSSIYESMHLTTAIPNQPQTITTHWKIIKKFINQAQHNIKWLLLIVNNYGNNKANQTIRELVDKLGKEMDNIIYSDTDIDWLQAKSSSYGLILNGLGTAKNIELKNIEIS
eukprot:441240_1